MKAKFPQFEAELIRLGEEDQTEIRGHYQALQYLNSQEAKDQQSYKLALNCHKRARRMREILEVIKKPTITNIGLKGSKTVSLLALHSYLDLMKRVLVIYENEFKKNPDNIYFQAIPPLTDRIMILEERVQYFGTNWSLAKDGTYFLIAVKDFAGMNERRAQYGLEPTKRPVILSTGADKYPLGEGKAKASDQKALTDEEYQDYNKYHLKSLI